MTDETDGASPPRPAFDALVADLRAFVKRQEQETIAKAEAARRNASEVMRKAAEMFGRGELSPSELVRLHALRMRLDGGLLPEER